MLLIQPLKPDEINISLKDDEEQEANEQQLLTPIDVIDDDVLLAILGLPPSHTSTALNSPVDESSLLDWGDMPELSEGEEEEDAHSKKRKCDDDIFAQFDFEEANLTHSHKKQCIDNITISSQDLL